MSRKPPQDIQQVIVRHEYKVVDPKGRTNQSILNKLWKTFTYLVK